MKLKGSGIKAGSLNCDVAEYSLSAYLHLYAKHINLSSKKVDVILGLSVNTTDGMFDPGAWIGYMPCPFLLLP